MAAKVVSAQNGKVVQRDLTFEERYELDKPLITRFTFPGLQHNGVFRVRRHMFRMGVKLNADMTSGQWFKGEWCDCLL